jgi:hypothetical protein
MSDYVFEINPAQYLYKANENKCYFVIHKCRLPGKNKDLFLIGDAFLRHFYSVYDFDSDQISLGINVHSRGQVSMFKPGERPADLKATQTTEDNVQVPAESPVEKPTEITEVQEVIAKSATLASSDSENKLPTDIDDTQIKSNIDN